MITPYNNNIIPLSVPNHIQTENIQDNSSRRILSQRREANAPDNSQNRAENATNIQKTSGYDNLPINLGQKPNAEASSFNRGSQLDITT